MGELALLANPRRPHEDQHGRSDVGLGLKPGDVERAEPSEMIFEMQVIVSDPFLPPFLPLAFSRFSRFPFLASFLAFLRPANGWPLYSVCRAD